MKIGDIVEYTDHHGAKHDAKVTRVVEQPTNIEGTEHTEIINVEYNAGGRVRIAELVSKRPNASGQCYGKVLKGDEEHDDTEADAPEDDEKREEESKDSDDGDDEGPHTTATETDEPTNDKMEDTLDEPKPESTDSE